MKIEMYIEPVTRYVIKGDVVIINNSNDSYIRDFVGQRGLVADASYSGMATQVSVQLESGRSLRVYQSDINVLPPLESIFQFNDDVKIVKTFEKTGNHLCKTRLLGKAGKIRAYDRRDSTYKVRCDDDDGWFPPFALMPLNFLGDHYYLPGEIVEFEGTRFTIVQTKNSTYGWGQLLWIEGRWVPSSEVKLITT